VIILDSESSGESSCYEEVDETLSDGDYVQGEEPNPNSKRKVGVSFSFGSIKLEPNPNHQ